MKPGDKYIVTQNEPNCAGLKKGNVVILTLRGLLEVKDSKGATWYIDFKYLKPVPPKKKAVKKSKKTIKKSIKVINK